MFIFDFIKNQTATELVMFIYTFIMLIWVTFILILKVINNGIVIRRKSLFQGITLTISLSFIVVSCLVNEMMKPVFGYQIFIGVFGVLINSLYISNFRISKLLGMEFSKEPSESFKQLIEYGKSADKISACMSDFTDKITALNVKWLKKIDGEGLIKTWVYCIDSFIHSRKVTAIEVVFDNMSMSDEILYNYIANIVNEKKLWYNKRAIKDFINDIRDVKVVKLQPNLYLIPIDNILIYVESEQSFGKADIEFIINTYRIVYKLK